MTETSSGEFFTAAQLIERWNGQVTKATLATWRSRNNGPAFVKIGGRVLYRREDIESYEAKNTRCK